MTHFRCNSRELVGLSIGLLVMLASPIASFGQSVPDGEFKREGITSYIFSPMAITVLLVLALVIQLVYWQYNRSLNRKAHVSESPQAAHAAQAAKKRYDREEMSKLLKASATSKSKPRALEEAIRLSQLTQPVLPERVEHLKDSADDVSENASQEASDSVLSDDFANETVVEDDMSTVIDDAPALEAEPQRDEREGDTDTEMVK